MSAENKHPRTSSLPLSHASAYLEKVGGSSGKPRTPSNATGPSKELDAAAGLFAADLQDTGPHTLRGRGNSHSSLSEHRE